MGNAQFLLESIDSVLKSASARLTEEEIAILSKMKGKIIANQFDIKDFCDLVAFLLTLKDIIEHIK